MWTTFLTTIKVSLREKSSLFWLFCFPIILSSMFMGMFGNLEQGYQLTTLRFAVVADKAFCESSSAQAVLAAMQRDPVEFAQCASAGINEHATNASNTGNTDLRNLLELRAVDSVDDAQTLINSDTSVRGYLTVDDTGMMAMTVSHATVSLADSPNTDMGLTISLSVLDSAIGMANRQTITVSELVTQDHMLISNPTFTQALTAGDTFTREVQLTNFKPDEGARYYYALLAMTALMAMEFAVSAVCMTQANISPLGMRRSLVPLPKWKQIMGGFLASWLCAFLSLLVAFVYIRLVGHISVGGRDLAAIGAIAVASFTASALGTFLGSLPKLSMNLKVGSTTAISCLLSLFSGLYGQGAMALSDTIQRDMPVLALINPAQQITDLFYDILYYDSYAPFLRTILVLAVMSALALGGATLFLRRQRYEYL